MNAQSVIALNICTCTWSNWHLLDLH